MRTFVLIATGTLVLFFAGALQADQPDLVKGVTIQDGATPLQCGLTTVPTAVDWNIDGNKDLVIGSFTNGYIFLYLNQGTDLNPVFNGGGKILSSGTAITTSYG